MGLVAPVMQNVMGSAISDVLGTRGDPLVFHALDTVAGSFVGDVIRGTGSLTEANTSTRYYADDSGVWQSFGSGVPGLTYANAKWWLVGQKACTNVITYSEDLTNASAWTLTGTGSRSLNVPNLKGAENGSATITDSDAVFNTRVERIIPLSANTNNDCWRVFLPKDTNEARFPGIQTAYAGGTAKSDILHINTKTGAFVEQDGGVFAGAEINSVENVWEVLLQMLNANNTSVFLRLYPALSTVIGTPYGGTQGSTAFLQVELHLNTTIDKVRGTAPIFTAGATGTVNVNDDSFDDAEFPAQGGAFIEWTPQYATAEVSGNIEIVSLDNNAGLLYYDADNSLLKSTDGTNTASVALTIVAGTAYKCWVAWGGTSLQVGVDATTGTATTFDGAFATGTKIEAVTPSVATNYVRNFRLYNQSFAGAVTTLQALAA